MRGRFISFEGGEGAGKSTQVRLIAQALETAGHPVLVTREPGGSPGAEEIRRLIVTGEPGRWDPMTEALLISAARRDHVRVTIEPALAAGRWVVSDRFADSTTAYQGFGHGVDRADLELLRRLATGGLQPDLTIILDLPVASGLARAATRHGDETRFERMDTSFHDRLRQGFLAIAAADPVRCAVVDATADPPTVHRAIRTLIADRLAVPAW